MVSIRGLSREHRFWPSEESPRRARKAVRHVVLAWECGEDVADVAELLTSELATNAVVHAQDGRERDKEYVVEITARDGFLTVGVTDFGHGMPRARHAEDDDEHGRGLGLVKGLADVWGIEHIEGGGKHVFFSLRVQPIPQHVHDRERAAASRGDEDPDNSECVPPGCCSSGSRSSIVSPVSASTAVAAGVGPPRVRRRG